MHDAPLHGFTVGITADRRWEEQAELLRRRGAAVLHGPTIRTLALTPSESGLRRATDSLIEQPPRILIANTGIGIRAWLAAADSWGLGDGLLAALATCRIFARGPKASAAVHQAGLDVAAKAASERLDEVIDLVVAEGVRGVRVAFQRHGDDVPDTIARLAAAGAEIVEIPVYEWILPEDSAPSMRLAEGLISGRVHAVTFTSAPAVRNLFSIAAEYDLAEPLRAALQGERALTACVGPVCAEAAHAEGIPAPIVPAKARLGPLIRSLTDRLVERKVTLTILGKPVTIAGTVVSADAGRLELSEREAQVLHVLARRPGAVVSKAVIAQDLWGSDADERSVEVVMGRVRRRLGDLGDLGDAIVTVPRRGYRLDASARAATPASAASERGEG